MPQPLSQRPTVYASSGERYARLYINLLRKLQRVDTVQAVLVAINEMLAANPMTSIPLFHSLASKESPDDPYAPIVKCLGMEEELVILASLRILGVLIA